MVDYKTSLPIEGEFVIRTSGVRNNAPNTLLTESLTWAELIDEVSHIIGDTVGDAQYDVTRGIYESIRYLSTYKWWFLGERAIRYHLKANQQEIDDLPEVLRCQTILRITTHSKCTCCYCAEVAPVDPFALNQCWDHLLEHCNHCVPMLYYARLSDRIKFSRRLAHDIYLTFYVLGEYIPTPLDIQQTSLWTKNAFDLLKYDIAYRILLKKGDESAGAISILRDGAYNALKKKEDNFFGNPNKITSDFERCADTLYGYVPERIADSRVDRHGIRWWPKRF